MHCNVQAQLFSIYSTDASRGTHSKTAANSMHVRLVSGQQPYADRHLFKLLINASFIQSALSDNLPNHSDQQPKSRSDSLEPSA